MAQLRPLAAPWILYPLLFGWGFALCWSTGVREIFALDQSIIYDGGWRLLQGQVPYRDFVTPMGLAPILVQAAFFQVLSISWYSYVAHAAVFNGLYGVLVLAFMSRAGAPCWLSVLVGFCSGVVFYPPFGTPFFDQHAFFFSLLACYLVLAIETAQAPRMQNLAAFAVPWCVAIAALSKPNPTVLVLPLVGLLGMFLPRAVFCRALSYGLIGLASSLLLGVAVVRVWGIPLDVWWSYAITLPSSVGSERLAGVSLYRIVDYHVVPWHKLFGRDYLHMRQVLPNAAIWGAVLWAAGRRGDSVPRAEARVQLRLGVLFGCLTIVSVVFQLMTNNNHTNGMAFLFLIYGLSLGGVVRLLPFLGLSPRGLGVAWLAILSLGIAPMVDGAARFHRVVNLSREVHEVDLRDVPRIDFEMPARLAGLQLYDRERYDRDFADLQALIAFFDENPGNFLLLSDFTVLFALTGRDSANYPLWIHSTVSIPEAGTPEYARFVSRQLELLEERDVRFVVRGEMWINRDHTPWSFVDALTEGPTRHFGGLSVTRLRRPSLP